jgi:hypothetical protein
MHSVIHNRYIVVVFNAESMLKTTTKKPEKPTELNMRKDCFTKK